MKTTLMMTAVLASLSLTSLAQAQTANPAPGDAPATAGQPERPDFATLDANGDGALTLEEMQAEGATRFAAADTNGDGGLSAVEMSAQMDQRRADRMEQMIAKRDTNGDGLLQADEMGPRGDRMDKMFARMDANDDGTIDAAEFEAKGERMDRRGHGGRDGHGDHDGKGRKPRG